MIAPVALPRVADGFSTISGPSPARVPALRDDSRMLRTLARAALPLIVLAPPWVWPVDAPHTIVREFVAPQTPYSAGHRGIDVAAPAGTVYAPADGVVHFAGVVVDRPVLSIEQAGGVLTSFEPVVTALSEGDPVERGQVVGAVLPGHCPSLCLHFGVRVDGEYVSPLLWLGGIERAILLPTRRSEAGGERPPTVEGHGSG